MIGLTGSDWLRSVVALPDGIVVAAGEALEGTTTLTTLTRIWRSADGGHTYVFDLSAAGTDLAAVGPSRWRSSC